MNAKTAGIVGVGPGIGMAVARRFAREGFQIALLARKADALDGFAAELKDDAVRVQTYPTDIADHDDVQRTFYAICKDFGAVDVLILNAAVISPLPISQLPLDELTRLFHVNVVGLLDCIQQVLPDMRARREGAILITGTSSAITTHPFSPGYGATKSALRMLGLQLAEEVQTENVHVAVVTVFDQIKRGSRYADEVAGYFWALYQQPLDQWSSEVLCSTRQVEFGSPRIPFVEANRPQ